MQPDQPPCINAAAELITDSQRISATGSSQGQCLFPSGMDVSKPSTQANLELAFCTQSC